MLLRSEAYIKLAYCATEVAQVLSYSSTRAEAEATGLGVALNGKASSESEVAGCLIWRSLASRGCNRGYAGCRAGTIRYGFGFVAVDQTSFFAARVKQWHQSGRWMDDVRGLLGA